MSNFCRCINRYESFTGNKITKEQFVEKIIASTLAWIYELGLFEREKKNTTIKEMFLEQQAQIFAQLIIFQPPSPIFVLWY